MVDILENDFQPTGKRRIVLQLSREYCARDARDTTISGCEFWLPVAVSGWALAFPEAFGKKAGAQRYQCSNLLENYQESGAYPEPGTAERAKYLDCYQVICGTRPAW